jgi:hypothetical protein
MPHLWEVDHDYYCTDDNYYARNLEEVDSWQEFVIENADLDMDWNLLFRWDWRDSTNPDYEIDNDELHLYFMAQRKGRFFAIVVKVSKEDESEISKWLTPRLQYLIKLWQPLVVTPEPAQS